MQTFLMTCPPTETQHWRNSDPRAPNQLRLFKARDYAVLLKAKLFDEPLGVQQIVTAHPEAWILISRFMLASWRLWAVHQVRAEIMEHFNLTEKVLDDLQYESAPVEYYYQWPTLNAAELGSGKRRLIIRAENFRTLQRGLFETFPAAVISNIDSLCIQNPGTWVSLLRIDQEPWVIENYHPNRNTLLQTLQAGLTLPESR